MYAKSSLLVTTAVTALIAGAVFSSSNITSAYAANGRADHLFCFTFIGTNSLGDPALIGHCYTNMGTCQKGEDQFVSEGGTVVNHCYKLH